jgi:hypothetical protein
MTSVVSESARQRQLLLHFLAQLFRHSSLDAPGEDDESVVSGSSLTAQLLARTLDIEFACE